MRMKDNKRDGNIILDKISLDKKNELQNNEWLNERKHALIHTWNHEACLH